MSWELLPPRREERQVRKFNFFAAFAPLREIFRFLVAASPRWVLRGGNFFTVKPEEALFFCVLCLVIGAYYAIAQIRTSLSSQADTSVMPSGENARSLQVFEDNILRGASTAWIILPSTILQNSIL